jgi:hypothetical protein
MKKWSILLASLIAVEAISITLYLTRARQFGFPLDDAWIHQAYARNLGLHGMMAFSPGIPSSGNTSFLWTLLLALGYFLKVPFFLWTMLLGGIFAVAAAFVAALLNHNYFGNFRNSVIVAIICIFEWHLAWAAVSGMEIGLFTCLTLLFFLLASRNVSPWILGALTALIVLARPEGILLAVIYAFKLLLTQPREIKRILLQGASFASMFLIVISPWIAFNFIYAHHPFPNTITAKFMHYGYPWSPLRSLGYLWNVFLFFLDGSLLLLFPGACFKLFNSVQKKDTFQPQPLLWSLTLIGIYAVTLPFIYDEGRYLMPLIPLVIVYGVEGISQFLEIVLRTSFMRSTAWMLLFISVFALWIMGSARYSTRIKFYELIHMQVAQWINDNTSSDTVIATHDIGIIGYFTNRQIVDLAGLVTPEIVPIMDDPQKIAEYLRSRHASYLIVYSSSHREVIRLLNARQVFSPNPELMRAEGVGTFDVYQIGK